MAVYTVKFTPSLFLEDKLKLRLNREKSAVAPVGERKFLGHRLLLNGKLGISPPGRLPVETGALVSCRSLSNLKLFLIGWLAYYRFAACRFELQCLDEWIRRKLCCSRLKPCKRGKSVTGFFQRLGVSPSLAHRVASSGKGWWRLSLTRPAHQAISADWFATQGLVSLVLNYDSLRH